MWDYFPLEIFGFGFSHTLGQNHTSDKQGVFGKRSILHIVINENRHHGVRWEFDRVYTNDFNVSK
jgi:hypothetical protein